MSTDLNYVFSTGKNRKDDCPPIKTVPIPVDRDENPNFQPDDPCRLDERKIMKLNERRKRKHPKVTKGNRKNN